MPLDRYLPLVACCLAVGCGQQLAGGPPDDEDGDVGKDDTAEDAGGVDPIVIIGGGVAGLAAAGALGEGVLVEADTVLGGRALWSGGLMHFVGIPDQEAIGVVDSPALAAADWEALTGWPAADGTLRYLEDSAATHERLLELGLSYGLLANEPRTDVQRLLTVTGEGPALVEALAAKVTAAVEVRLETLVEGLVWRDGAVVGVRTADGEIPARAVVIASGGYAGELARLAELAEGEFWEASKHGGAGHALAWAEADDLGVKNLPNIGWLHRHIGVPMGDGKLIGFTYDIAAPWIWVDENGLRFLDETDIESVTLTGPLRAAGDVWAIGPRDAVLAALDEVVRPTAEQAIAVDSTMRCRADASALAELLVLDPEALSQTLGEVAGVESGSLDDPLGRPAESFVPFTGDLCAWRPGDTASKTYGGLMVDEDGRVLNTAGGVVPGLWAVGEAAGMGAPGLAGRYGFDGTLSAVVWSGWRVGDRLASE